jgi:uncharacterized protein
VLYLIDGYNLLFRVSKEKRSLQKKREAIIAFLSEKVSLFKFTLLLVFDSVNTDEIEARRGHKGPLEIVYTAKKQTADDYILEEVGHRKNPRQLTVITSDRDLAGQCRLLGANTMSVEEFLDWIDAKQTAHTKRKRAEKVLKETDYHLQRLLDIFEKRLLDDKDEN